MGVSAGDWVESQAGCVRGGRRCRCWHRQRAAATDATTDATTDAITNATANIAANTSNAPNTTNTTTKTTSDATNATVNAYVRARPQQQHRPESTSTAPTPQRNRAVTQARCDPEPQALTHTNDASVGADSLGGRHHAGVRCSPQRSRPASVATLWGRSG